MEPDFLQLTWFFLVAILLGAFFVTGGFDFGAGLVQGFLKSADKRDFVIRTITPFWDANQVWLITAGGALFAAFPKAYSAVLSNLYTPVMLLLACLIFRVMAVELYHYGSSSRWKAFFSAMLSVASFASVLFIGISLGCVFSGTLMIQADFPRSVTKIFTLYTSSAAMLCLAYFAAHGAVFMALNRMDSEDCAQYAVIARRCMFLLLLAYMFYLVVFILNQRTLWSLAALALAYPPLSYGIRCGQKGKFKKMFVCTGAFALTLVCAHAALAVPHIIAPLPGVSAGLGIAEAASSEKTLKIMLLVALTGVPLAVGYSVYAHLVFSRRMSGGRSKS